MKREPTPSASSDAERFTTITRLALRSFIYVIFALFLAAAITLVLLSHSIDKHQVSHSETDAARAFEIRQDKIGTALGDYAFWIDAYNYTKDTINLTWVFDQDNIGPSLFSTYGLEGVFIVGPTSETRYGIIDGQLSDISASEWIQGDLPALLDQARIKSVEDEIAYAYFPARGTPAVVSAAVIRPESTYDQFNQLSYLIYIDILTDAKLKEIEETFDLIGLNANLQATPISQRPHIRLQQDVGEPLTLQWKSEGLGRMMLSNMLPMLILLGILVAVMVKNLSNRITHASEMIEAGQHAIWISEQRFKNISEASSDWIWETDIDLNLTYLSERFNQVTGLTSNEWIGRPLPELLSYNASMLASLVENANLTGRKPILCELRDSNNRLHYCQLLAFKVRMGEQVQGYQGTVCDITQEIKDKAHIEHISQHDALTGLANRHRLNRHLNEHLNKEVNSNHPLFLLALDLDRFKPINDTFGHAAGDFVLRHIANTITRCLRESDMVARLGGDEFIVVATDCRTYEQAEQLCKRLIEQINLPIKYEAHDINVSTSIGIAAAPFHGLIANDLLRFADIALYEAKASGRNLFRFYVPAMNERIMERRQLEMDMRQALRRQEFRLDFQPRFDVSSRTIVGAEALVRWLHPTRELLSPAYFIPLAEETGLIFELSDWVMNNACLNAQSWGDHLMVSVNLSPVEFHRDDLVNRVAAVLKKTGIAPHRLELEITESVMLEDAASALLTMNNLKALGVRLSMDDFGTGYSSLSYVHNYPFDGLKIDQSFIMGLDQSRSSEAIVDAIISMGHALALTVTAEGIETAEQLGKLEAFDCDQAQGYSLGRPMSPRLFKEAIKDAVLR